MAMTPKKGSNKGGGFREDFKRPLPKKGNRKARVSLIVDLGTQEREDFVDPKTGETKPQAPCQQIAMYVDLTHDVVDYGGTIGKAPYRLCLNKSFMGEMSGINFQTVPPKDGNGNIIEGKDWTYHPASMITKVAKATGVTSIVDGSDIDIEQLLNKTLMVDIDIKEKDSGKTDEKGEKIIYKNVVFKTLSSVPMDEDDDGNEVEAKVNDCAVPPTIITFDNVTEETVKYLRADIRKKLKAAAEYPGSEMQKQITAYEATLGSSSPAEGSGNATTQGDDKEAPVAPAKAAKAPKKQADLVDDTLDDNQPF